MKKLFKIPTILALTAIIDAVYAFFTIDTNKTIKNKVK